MDDDAPRRLADGLWWWTARHPEWHPGEFGRRVGSYAVVPRPDELVLVDPLVTSAAVAELLDELVAARVEILITIPYHVRSAAVLCERWNGRAAVRVHGHAAAGRRLGPHVPFCELAPGRPVGGGITAHAIGRPRRFEMPVHLPSHRAIAFGDAVVETGGRLRMWLQQPIDERRLRFYRERFAPTLRPLLELDAERVLVTHGEPVTSGGRAALAAALDAEPWYHPG